MLYNNNLLPLTQLLKENADVFREELENHLKRPTDNAKSDFIDYPVENSFKNSWTILGLLNRVSKGKYDQTKHSFPKSIAVLKKVVGLEKALFSCMTSDTIIYPHRDPTNHLLRTQICIIAPRNKKSGIIVGGFKVLYEEGLVFIFDTNKTHTAWNRSDVDRYVLIVDVDRYRALDLNKTKQEVDQYIANHQLPVTMNIRLNRVLLMIKRIINWIRSQISRKIKVITTGRRQKLQNTDKILAKSYSKIVDIPELG